MTVIRVNKTGDFTVMSNTHFREKEMSLKAKGLLGWRGHKLGRYLTYLKLIKEYL